MLTVDYTRLGLEPGDLVLDMGAGAGRHAFEVYRRGADIVALDYSLADLKDVTGLFAAMADASEVPAGGDPDGAGSSGGASTAPSGPDDPADPTDTAGDVPPLEDPLTGEPTPPNDPPVAPPLS